MHIVKRRGGAQPMVVSARLAVNLRLVLRSRLDSFPVRHPVFPVDALVAAGNAERGARHQGGRFPMEAADTPDLVFQVDDRVATLTLNRPDRLNALSDAMIDGA